MNAPCSNPERSPSRKNTQLRWKEYAPVFDKLCDTREEVDKLIICDAFDDENPPIEVMLEDLSRVHLSEREVNSIVRSMDPFFAEAAQWSIEELEQRTTETGVPLQMYLSQSLSPISFPSCAVFLNYAKRYGHLCRCIELRSATDDDLSILRNFPLKSLSLYGTEITDAALPELRQLSVRQLDLRETLLSYDAVQSLQRHFDTSCQILWKSL